MKWFFRSYAHLNEDSVIHRLIEQLQPKERFIVDIGAGDGKKMSNTYRFFKKGWPGLAFESNPRKFKRLKKNYLQFNDVSLSMDKVHPDSLEKVLHKMNVPSRILLLDLDIDSYDYFVLEAFLKRYRPAIVLTEINEIIPPPIKFKVLPSYCNEWQGGHFFGYSLACIDELLTQFPYKLYGLHYNNAILVSNEYWSGHSIPVKDAYAAGYWNKPNRRKKFHYNNHLEHFREMTPQEIANELNNLFKTEHGNFSLHI